MNFAKLIRLGFNRSRKKTGYEVTNSEKSVEGQNASRESDKKGERSKGLNRNKLLFNIKWHYRLPSAEKNNAEFEKKTGSKLVYDWRDYKIIQDNRHRDFLIGWNPPTQSH